jgi:hypothetical protein
MRVALFAFGLELWLSCAVTGPEVIKIVSGMSVVDRILAVKGVGKHDSRISSGP